MFLKNSQQNSVALTTNHETQKIVEECKAMHWTHQMALCHQPFHRGFTIKITDSPNMVVQSTCHGRFTEITGSPNIGTVIIPQRIYSIEY